MPEKAKMQESCFLLGTKKRLYLKKIKVWEKNSGILKPFGAECIAF